LSSALAAAKNSVLRRSNKEGTKVGTYEDYRKNKEDGNR
jgi:hypothetical protein